MDGSRDLATIARLIMVTPHFGRPLSGSRYRRHNPMTTRRRVLELFALAGATLAWLGPAGWLSQAFAQDAKKDATPAKPDDKKADAKEEKGDLAKPAALGDVALGPADAKVTIIEYASMTCTHCAHFHETTFPKLKQKYIDTGKVRFILREYPLDALAAAGFMIARCAGNDKYYAMTDLLFDKQDQWAFVDKPVDALEKLVKQAGFTQESFQACLKNKSIYDGVMATAKNGQALGVSSTPTFFINGQMQRGALSIEDLDKILTPLVGG
jgi:protein-disulfide isomerase